ncbi:unnamed protein product [Larinioides sclopetarius]|uniref:Uncharacterized protein n=1 Tax=Larinioides sclopetarius TaxID=280406 RepID=A0AAV2ANJ5_9ARAC
MMENGTVLRKYPRKLREDYFHWFWIIMKFLFFRIHQQLHIQYDSSNVLHHFGFCGSLSNCTWQKQMPKAERPCQCDDDLWTVCTRM